MFKQGADSPPDEWVGTGGHSQKQDWEPGEKKEKEEKDKDRPESQQRKRVGDRKTLSTLPTISGVGSVTGEVTRTAMMPAPWKGTGGGPLLSGMVRDPPGRSLRKGKLQGPPDCWNLRCLPGLLISLKPARFQNKHVQLPRHTILAARPQAEASELFPPRPAWAGDASCIFISTRNRGPRAAHAHYSPSHSPSPRQ